MNDKQLFRTAIVGGYNKKDVMAYIEALEKEIERLKEIETAAATLEKTVTDMLKNRGEQKTTLLPTEVAIAAQDLNELKEKAKKLAFTQESLQNILRKLSEDSSTDQDGSQKKSVSGDRDIL